MDGSAARAIIAHLRSGTVPEEGLEQLTVGREGWLKSFELNLDDASAGQKIVRLVRGRYGDGKTHLMAVLREMALRKGFAVSSVTIGAEVRLDRWDQLYRAVATSLESRDLRQAGGLSILLSPHLPDPSVAETFAARSRSVRDLPAMNASFASALYAYTTGQGPGFDSAENAMFLRSWLEGGGLATDVRRRFGIHENIDKNNAFMMLRSLVGALTHFGYPGVLVLIDEVEATLDQSERIRQNAYDNLRFIVDLAQLPPRIMVVASVTPELFSDDDAGFPSYPALWQRVGGFDLPGVVFDAPVADLGQTPLRGQDYFRLGEEIRRIHALGYGGGVEHCVDEAYLKAAAEQAARARGLSVAATRVYVKLIADELGRCRSEPNYRPDVRRLPTRFRRIDQELDSGRTKQQWT